MDTFKAHVLHWLQEQPGKTNAAEVLSVDSHGSDWLGSTEGGFYGAFSVDIRWRDTSGKKYHTDVDGEDMESLWRWVVGAWPAPAPAAEDSTSSTQN